MTLKSIPFKTTFTYSFEANGKKYNGKEKAYGIGQKDQSLLGKQYVVVYDPVEPSKSDLITDILIETDSDFQEFKKVYQNDPPQPDFPNKCE